VTQVENAAERRQFTFLHINIERLAKLQRPFLSNRREYRSYGRARRSQQVHKARPFTKLIHLDRQVKAASDIGQVASAISICFLSEEDVHVNFAATVVNEENKKMRAMWSKWRKSGGRPSADARSAKASLRSRETSIMLGCRCTFQANEFFETVDSGVVLQRSREGS